MRNFLSHLSQHGFAYTMHELPVPTRHILLQFPLLHPPNIITTLSSGVNLKTNRYEIPSLSISNQSLPNNFIDQQPVRLDVTFSHVLIISGISESMISIRLRQRLLVTQQRDHFLQLLRIAASLDRKLVISFELPRNSGLSIQRLHQICNAIKRTIHILSLSAASIAA